jgi:hypothetical protein
MIVVVGAEISVCAGCCCSLGTAMLPVAPGSRSPWSLVVGMGRRRSGRGVEFSDPGEHDGQQLVSGWEAKREPAGVANEAGWDAEQFVAQSCGVSSPVAVDPGECLE